MAGTNDMHAMLIPTEAPHPKWSPRKWQLQVGGGWWVVGGGWWVVGWSLDLWVAVGGATPRASNGAGSRRLHVGNVGMSLLYFCSNILYSKSA